MAQNTTTPDEDLKAIGNDDEVADISIEDTESVDHSSLDSVENHVPPAAPNQPNRRPGLSILFGIVLGGVVAAGIGFYAARYIVPEGWPFPGVTPEPNPIAVEQADQANRIATLEAQIGLQKQTIDELAGDQTLAQLTQKLGEAESRLTETMELLTAIDTRLIEVEKIPQGSGTEAAEAAAAAYERELATMRDMLSDELARIEAQGAAANASGQDAEALARQAQIDASFAQLRTALDNGQPFGNALTALGVEVPEVLAQTATEGVPTLTQLQEDFPAAARAALDVSIAAQVEDGSVGRFAGFMRRQLGGRSLEPREGDDPDAVLSRAEAAVKQGQLAIALTEVSALPPAGQAEMAVWVEQVQLRIDVLEAADTLPTLLSKE